MFKGMYPALVTPFKNGNFDDKSYIKLVKYVLSYGAAGVVPNGTTGENPTLKDHERREIIRIAVGLCREKGNKQVIAGAGSNNTSAAIDLVNDADQLGADGALVITPYYNKPTPTGLTLHFKEVAKNTDLPIVMYNVPSRTGVNMSAETAIELSWLDGIAGIKEASGDLIKFAEISAGSAEGFTMLSGEDGLTLPMMPLGCSGVISVIGNVAPRLMADMLDAWFSGDLEPAANAHFKMLPLIKALFMETSPAPCKKALEMLGICGADVRLPLAPVSEVTKNRLREAMESAGMFV